MALLCMCMYGETVTLSIVTMLYIRSPDLVHFVKLVLVCWE